MSCFQNTKEYKMYHIFLLIKVYKVYNNTYIQRHNDLNCSIICSTQNYSLMEAGKRNYGTSTKQHITLNSLCVHVPVCANEKNTRYGIVCVYYHSALTYWKNSHCVRNWKKIRITVRGSFRVWAKSLKVKHKGKSHFHCILFPLFEF